MSSLESYSVSLNNYLTQSLYYLQAPLTALRSQRSSLEVKRAVFTDLGAKLKALEDAADALSGVGTSSVLRAKDVTSSREAVVTSVATSEAAPGAHTVFVTQLARAHTVVSDRYTQEGTALSQSQSGTKTFSITVGGETYDVSVEIADGESDQTVLTNIASAIRDATDLKVTASAVMDTPSTAKLSIRSGSMGTAGAMSFVDTDGLLASLGVTNQSEATDTAGGYVYADLGGNELDAMLTVDGINVISSTNVVSSVITGLSITLLAEQQAGDTPVTLTVSVATESIKSEIETFLEAYNDAFSYLMAKTHVDGVTYERGLLSGDFPYTSLRMNMRQAMSSLIGGSAADYNALSQIGITSNRSGAFSISDEDLLEEVLLSDPNAVHDLLGSENGVAAALASLISGYTSPGGTISVSQDGIDSRVDVIDDRIVRQEKNLSLREQELRRQYAELQDALDTLEMMTAMTNSFSNLVGL
jgi:flagellar hook-associated protein 2